MQDLSAPSELEVDQESFWMNSGNQTLRMTRAEFFFKGRPRSRCCVGRDKVLATRFSLHET